MNILISRNGVGKIGKFRFKCSIGKKGVTDQKFEGDNKTPLGTFPLRFVMYRKDKLKRFKTNLPLYLIKKSHVCCDDPNNTKYNKIYIKEEESEKEPLWRKDSLYNIIIVIGYNDQPVQKNKGSAIFIHLSTKKYAPTKGCVSISLNDMKKILSYNIKKIKII